MADNLVQELFAVPFGLDRVGDIDNIPVYSSAMLRASFINAILKQGMLRPTIGNVKSLIDKRLIIPCMADSGLLTHIARQTFSHQKNVGFQGAYIINEDKIYIVIDSRAKNLFWVSNFKMSYILMHELMHMASRHGKNNFYKIFKQDYAKFYRIFFSNFLDIQVDDTFVEDMVLYMFRNLEWIANPPITQSHLSRYYEFLHSGLTQYLDREDAIKVVTMITTALKLFLSNRDAFLRFANSNKLANRMIFSFYDTYKALGIKDPDTTPIQEFLFPSEVIAILSIMAKPTHFAAIRLVT